MESEPKLMLQYWKDEKKLDLPENCGSCKLIYANCDHYCFYGSEECLKNIRHHQEKNKS